MRYATILAALALAGCDLTAPEFVVPGSYSLRSVEGRAIPAPALGGYHVVGGLLTLTEDGRYRDSVAVRGADGSWTSYHLADGPYTLDGDYLTLEPQWGTPSCKGRIDRSGYACDSPHGRLVWVRM